MFLRTSLTPCAVFASCLLSKDFSTTKELASFFLRLQTLLIYKPLEIFFQQNINLH